MAESALPVARACASAGEPGPPRPARPSSTVTESLKPAALARAACRRCSAASPHLFMEKRIEQGKASGALNDKEAARLEKRKANLEQAEDRAKADGKVTRQERERLNHKADSVSRDIHREKHDKQTAAPAPEAPKQ